MATKQEASRWHDSDGSDLIVFVLTQRFVFSGITAGASKDSIAPDGLIERFYIPVARGDPTSQHSRLDSGQRSHHLPTDEDDIHRSLVGRRA